MMRLQNALLISLLSLGTWWSHPAQSQSAAASPVANSLESPVASLSLEQIMQDPDWIGAPVEQAWWAWDGDRVYYRMKAQGSELRELHEISLDSGNDQNIAPQSWGEADGNRLSYDQQRQRAVFIRDGDVFVRDLSDGALRQLTRTSAAERSPRFSLDGSQVYFQRGQDWFRYDLAAGLESALTQLQFAADPNTASDDALEKMQLRLFHTLREQERNSELQREQLTQRREDDASLSVAPWYLGAGWSPQGSELSPDGRWLLVVVQAASHDDGQTGKMPRYVTRSGYVDIEDVRPRVGRNLPAAQSLWLLDLQQHEKTDISYAELPGITEDVLAFLKSKDQSDKARKKSKAKESAEEKPRDLSVLEIQWQPQGGLAAVQLRANDNKDRWIATVDPQTGALTPRHRLHDRTWINWLFNDFGWLPDGQSLWFMSEESGYSHFYTLALNGKKAKALTQGKFEVMDPIISADGHYAYVLSNREHPSAYDVYRLDIAQGELTALTQMRGVEDFSLSPQQDQLLIRWSASYTPAQISVLDLSQSTASPRQLTDTRCDDYRALSWQQPEILGVPSSHGDEPIWSKFYPVQGRFQGPRPIVLFVHGAGYTQNTHYKFPYYFREQMFHNLLTERGYLVLDMDYRASRGYGREWRGAIYRQMGHPELEDLIDGVNWLVREHGGDPNRVGVYGGSYGGFMSLMAMFRAPEVFHAGAALRPVTDWAHYNHGYTSNILNTPEQDPEAYLRSSPIEFADALQGHLLIAHGMLDDNVFFQDSVRLAQRLIELKKSNWELAPYPMEPHGFIYAESWLDEYRRIYRLFDQTISDSAQRQE